MGKVRSTPALVRTVILYRFGSHTYRAVRWCIAAVFLYAGACKLFFPETFALVIRDYGLVPEILVVPIAVALPTLEVVASVGLLFDLRGSLTLSAGLLVFFMGILGYGIWMGLDVDCGCFSPGDPEAGAYHGLRTAFVRDAFLLVGAMFLFLWRSIGLCAPTRIGQKTKREKKA